MINRDIANRIIQPRNQRVKRCRFCGHKLTFRERHKVSEKGGVLCPKCGEVYRNQKVVY